MSIRTPISTLQDTLDAARSVASFDPVCKVVSMLKDLASQSRPIDPRLLHCCLTLMTAGSTLPVSGDSDLPASAVLGSAAESTEDSPSQPRTLI